MISFVFGEKNLVNFCLVTMEIRRLNHTHTKGLFQKTIFQPLRGVALPDFYTR